MSVDEFLAYLYRWPASRDLTLEVAFAHQERIYRLERRGAP